MKIQTLSIERTWSQPKMEYRSKLGVCPDSYYQPVNGPSQPANPGSWEFGGDCPVQDAEGHPVMEDVTQTLQAQQYYPTASDLLSQAGKGALVGAGLSLGVRLLRGGSPWMGLAGLAAGAVAGVVTLEVRDRADRLREGTETREIHEKYGSYSSNSYTDYVTSYGTGTVTNPDGTTSTIQTTTQTPTGTHYYYSPEILDGKKIGEYKVPVIQHSADRSKALQWLAPALAGVAVGFLP